MTPYSLGVELNSFNQGFARIRELKWKDPAGN